MAKKKTKSSSAKRRQPNEKSFVLQGSPFTSDRIRFRIKDQESPIKRADLQFHGLSHAGVSYEGRVFLNNRRANAITPIQADEGYAGSYHVFGHGTCFGDPGHCEINSKRRTRDHRSGHPLTPAFKRLIITDALNNLNPSTTSFTITIVPIVKGGDRGCDLENVIRFKELKFVTYS